jgi:fermentation-respiration switch protein FrsA (DUF1100 family)
VADPPRPRTWRQTALRWVLFLALVWVGVVVVMAWLENSLVYHPVPELVPPPAADVEDVWFTSADGTKLHGWWLPGEPTAGAVLVSHGNGGNLSHRGRLGADLRQWLGRPVLLFDYPGYGKCDGSPSEAGCYAAGDAAYRWLTDEKGVPAGRIVLFGESLGGGVATELATRHDHEALVLAKAFTSMPAVAKGIYPWLPTHTFMANRYDNLSKLSRVTKPVFVAHGTDDTLVPFAHAERLFAAANGPKELFRLEGHDHNAWLPSEFHSALKKFLDRHRK